MARIRLEYLLDQKDDPLRTPVRPEVRPHGRIRPIGGQSSTQTRAVLRGIHRPFRRLRDGLNSIHARALYPLLTRHPIY